MAIVTQIVDFLSIYCNHFKACRFLREACKPIDSKKRKRHEYNGFNQDTNPKVTQQIDMSTACPWPSLTPDNYLHTFSNRNLISLLIDKLSIILLICSLQEWFPFWAILKYTGVLNSEIIYPFNFLYYPYIWIHHL